MIAGCYLDGKEISCGRYFTNILINLIRLSHFFYFLIDLKNCFLEHVDCKGKVRFAVNAHLEKKNRI